MGQVSKVFLNRHGDDRLTLLWQQAVKGIPRPRLSVTEALAFIPSHTPAGYTSATDHQQQA
jgi:hypothetical protein